jgi:hypothetical protein
MSSKTAEDDGPTGERAKARAPRASLGRDFLRTTIGDALLPLLQDSMEDVVFEALDRRQVPTRTDFKELRDLQNSLRGQLVGATGGVKRLSELVDDQDQRISAAEASLAALEARLTRLEASLTGRLPLKFDDDNAFSGGPSGVTRASPDGSSSGREAAPEPSSNEAERCAVPGCTDSPRARGYCARHYQKWRRGTLQEA